MVTKQLSKGQLLIAEPSIIGDISFNRSVILLADHTHEGSVGFIMNKPLNYTINDLVPDVDADFKIYTYFLFLRMAIVFKVNKWQGREDFRKGKDGKDTKGIDLKKYSFSTFILLQKLCQLYYL